MSVKRIKKPIKPVDKKIQIVKLYAELNKQLGRQPKMDEVAASGFTKDSIKHHFSSLARLDKAARKSHPACFLDVEIKDMLTSKALLELRKSISSTKKFLITTAVTGCAVDESALASVKTYEKASKSLPLIMMAADPAHVSSKGGYGSIAKKLSSELIVMEDTSINSNLFLSTIKLSAKHIDPTTGLDRIGQRSGSFILASPKQRLNMVATSNEKLPHAIMTTGAITKANYSTESYMSERTAYIAEEDHIMGGLIVEVADTDMYHYRQFQFRKDGSFVDLGKKYSPNGKVTSERPAALVLGDWHSGSTDPKVRAATKEMIQVMRPKMLIIHDAFDGISINHHEEHNLLSKAVKFIKNGPTLKSEIEGLRDDLDWMATLVDEVVVVKSNHDEFLSKYYLQKAKYAEDPQNHYYALDIAKAMMEGKDPLKFAVEAAGLKNKTKIRWLRRDEDLKVANVQLGAHGDKGPNGSRGSLKGMHRSYGDSVTGHSHTPGILHGAWAVGTSSYLKLSYNQGPSSWMQAHCIVYDDGSRQLVNIIDGKWRIV